MAFLTMHKGGALCYYFLKATWLCKTKLSKEALFLPIQDMSRRFLFLSGIIFLLIVIVGGILITRARVFAAPDQPVTYSHKTHTAVGIQCLYCHVDATRSEIATIPSVEKCMGCHSFIATEGDSIQEIVDYWNRGEPIPWERVNIQPDFVYFSHQPHILSGLNCETCHGDVSSMDAATPVVKMDMGWCIKCHLEQPEEQIDRLVDCLACHK
jgi:hypothetical protein